MWLVRHIPQPASATEETLGARSSADCPGPSRAGSDRSCPGRGRAEPLQPQLRSEAGEGKGKEGKESGKEPGKEPGPVQALPRDGAGSADGSAGQGGGVGRAGARARLGTSTNPAKKASYLPPHPPRYFFQEEMY